MACDLTFKIMISKVLNNDVKWQDALFSKPLLMSNLH